MEDGRDTEDIKPKIRLGRNFINQLHPAIWSDRHDQATYF